MYDSGTVGSQGDTPTHEAGWPPVAAVTRPTPLREAAAPITAEFYREAMARLASAVHVVTTDGPGGRAGFTASAVCSVSDAPPTLLVCLNRGASAHPVIGRNGTLCVNTLSADQQAVATAFGGGTPMAARFAAAAWTRLATGAPVLVGSLLAFDCRIVERSSVATHDVLFCEVVALARPAETASLLYAGRRYHSLPHPASDAPRLRRA